MKVTYSAPLAKEVMVEPRKVLAASPKVDGSLSYYEEDDNEFA